MFLTRSVQGLDHAMLWDDRHHYRRARIGLIAGTYQSFGSDRMSTFSEAFSVVISTEGGLTTNRADPGNWTGGKPGVGECRGTKYGISASAFPDLDIRTLTVEQAQEIYRRDYWDRIAGDALPPPLALLALDAAVNHGPHLAALWLQHVAGVATDGIIGPVTLAAINAAVRKPDDGIDLCANYLALRLSYMASLPTWRSFGLGWARRLFRLPYQTLKLSR